MNDSDDTAARMAAQMKDWRLHAQRKAHCHSVQSASEQRKHKIVGSLAAALSATVATLLSACSEFRPHEESILTLLSLGAAVLAAIQTINDWTQASADHSKSNERYAEFRTFAEAHIAASTVDADALQEGKELLGLARRDEPPIPNKVWARAKKRYPRTDGGSAE